MTEVLDFPNKISDRIKLLILKNDYLTLHTTNYGCTILKLLCKDRSGCERDVVLGYDTIEEYATNDGYLGALIGRTANRIKDGRFVLGGKEYSLAVNNAVNSLHGGIKGFSYQIFDYEAKENELIFYYVSDDMEEGYPGRLTLKTSYRLDKDRLIINYQAEADADTLVNITNHSYFNLSGRPSHISDHSLRISADSYACVDENGLVTGELSETAGTAFDFVKEAKIGDRMSMPDKQLETARGYDHPFIFSSDKDQVVLYCESTGIELIVSTTLPQAQIYSANYLDGRIGKYGASMSRQSGLCIETQYMPNDINLNPQSPTILRKGRLYDESTSYQLRLR